MSPIIKKITTAGVLLMFLFFTIAESTMALVYTPGVTPGETFEYDVTAYWSSSDEYASIPKDLVEINQTKTVEVRISSVVGSNVSIFVAVYYRNDTQVGGYSYVDVDSGLDAGGPFVAIIGGNLKAFDPVHPLGADYIYINETVVKSYESGSRDTNRILIEYTNATSGISGRVDRFFDKEVGILVESHERSTSINPETTTTVSWNIKSSNAWVIPEFPSLLFLPLLMITTIVVIVAFKKKYKGNSNHLIFNQK